MNAALMAYRWPGVSRFVLAHVLTESLPPVPKGGRHAREKRQRRPWWLRRGARKCADVTARWWLGATEDDAVLNRLEAQFKPITGTVLVSFPRLVVPVAQVAGRPPWAAEEVAR